MDLILSASVEYTTDCLWFSHLSLLRFSIFVHVCVNYWMVIVWRCVCVHIYGILHCLPSNMSRSVKHILTHKRTHIYSAQPNILDFLFGNCVNLNLILKFKPTMTLVFFNGHWTIYVLNNVHSLIQVWSSHPFYIRNIIIHSKLMCVFLIFCSPFEFHLKSSLLSFFHDFFEVF